LSTKPLLRPGLQEQAGFTEIVFSQYWSWKNLQLVV
jgi:hypothetical protein